MKKLVVAIAAVTVMAFASMSAAFAGGPVAEEKGFRVLLEVSGITADDKTIIGGFKSISFKSISGLDSGDRIVLERGYTATDDL